MGEQNEREPVTFGDDPDEFATRILARLAELGLLTEADLDELTQRGTDG